jgi:N-acetylglucosamine malate deacetylase 1
LAEPEVILVVAAHPDDEALGCGASVARWTQLGASASVLFLADGVFARGVDGGKDAELLRRRNAAQRAGEILGFSDVSFLEFPDNRLDTVPLLALVQAVESAVDQLRPDTVLTHHVGDVNIDHRRLHHAVVTACRPQPGRTVRRLLFFEVASSTEWQPPGSAPSFQPNWFVDVGDTLEAKLAALECYEEEMREWPHSRSTEALRALALWRGATAGFEAAEAFMLGRLLE